MCLCIIIMCAYTDIVLYCVGDIKDAARDTNSLYHRKYLLHGWQQAISQPRGLLLVQYV